jgi:hypothetical protein
MNILWHIPIYRAVKADDRVKRVTFGSLCIFIFSDLLTLVNELPTIALSKVPRVLLSVETLFNMLVFYFAKSVV